MQKKKWQSPRDRYSNRERVYKVKRHILQPERDKWQAEKKEWQPATTGSR